MNQMASMFTRYLITVSVVNISDCACSLCVQIYILRVFYEIQDKEQSYDVSVYVIESQ